MEISPAAGQTNTTGAAVSTKGSISGSGTGVADFCTFCHWRQVLIRNRPPLTMNSRPANKGPWLCRAFFTSATDW